MKHMILEQYGKKSSLNLENLHPFKGGISEVKLFRNVLSLQIEQYFTEGWKSINHLAVLICISGFVLYEDEFEVEMELECGDYVIIRPEIKHRIKASLKSQLILLK